MHPYSWLWEPLESEPSFVSGAMFGAKTVYLDGMLRLCLPAKEEPWRGVMVCTDKVHHESLMQEFPSLAPHPILPKWLYLSESDDDFEPVATGLIELVRQRDSRIGVVPKPKRSGGSSSRAKAVRGGKTR